MRRDPIKTALSLAPSVVLSWYWWGCLFLEHHGGHAWPVSLFFCLLWVALCTAFWVDFTRPLQRP